MTKGIISAATLFTASPAMAHVSEPHLHLQGFETTAVASGTTALVAIAWWLGSRHVAS